MIKLLKTVFKNLFIILPFLFSCVQSGDSFADNKQECIIAFQVKVPEYTASNAKISISGNHPKLGNWAPGKINLVKGGRQSYHIKISFEKGAMLQYKFTQGSWETVEKDKNFNEIQNRTLIVEKDETINITVENWAERKKISKKHTLTGNIVLIKNFKANLLKNNRDIIVYLPPDYYINLNKRYPVLYMHDGNNIFDKATSAYGFEWSSDETAQKLIKDKFIKEIIVVGIYNNENRHLEYTYHRDKKYGGGKLLQYSDFIINDLKPYMDKKFRTLPDRENTAVAGSSLGGLCSFYLGWLHPEIFSKAAVISPALWWAGDAVIKMVNEYNGPKKDLAIWLDMGTMESKNAIEKARNFKDILVKKGYQLNKDLQYLEAKDAIHNESAWADRFDKILIFFFGNK